MNTAMISGQGAGEDRLPERHKRPDAEVLVASPASRPASPRKNTRATTVGVWPLVGLAGALMIAALVRVVLDPEVDGPARTGAGCQWVAGVTCTAVGGVVAAVHAHNRVAWLLLGIGTLSAASLSIGAYMHRRASAPGVARRMDLVAGDRLVAVHVPPLPGRAPPVASVATLPCGSRFSGSLSRRSRWPRRQSCSRACSTSRTEARVPHAVLLLTGSPRSAYSPPY